MKKVIFIITALALMAITLPACAAEGVSQEEYEELRQQLDVIEAKFDPLEAELSEQLRQQIDVVVAEFGPLVAKLSEIQEELEDVHTQVTEEPMTRGKLVGQGSYAEWSYPGETDVNHLSTGFMVTNPDGVSEITIDRISVFAFDGTVIYEGLLRVKVNDHWEVYTGPLKPHEIVGTDLEYYDLPELTREVEMQYTVEIFWTWTDKEGLPLIGWATSFIVVRDAEGLNIDRIVQGGTQMVNME